MDFYKRHYLLSNLVLMLVAGILLVAIAMWGLGLWTAHGQVQVVPDVHALPAAEAGRIISGCNLKVEVVDSVYDSAVSRGSVVEQMPPAGNRVKPGRTVYLTINAYSPRQVTLPELVGSSLRQARASLQSMGFSDIREVRVPSDYRDLVLAVKSMGVNLHAGTKIPLNSTIVIEVGEGYDVYDSIDEAVDSIMPLSDDEWNSSETPSDNE